MASEEVIDMGVRKGAFSLDFETWCSAINFLVEKRSLSFRVGKKVSTLFPPRKILSDALGFRSGLLVATSFMDVPFYVKSCSCAHVDSKGFCGKNDPVKIGQSLTDVGASHLNWKNGLAIFLS